MLLCILSYLKTNLCWNALTSLTYTGLLCMYQWLFCILTCLKAPNYVLRNIKVFVLDEVTLYHTYNGFFVFWVILGHILCEENQLHCPKLGSILHISGFVPSLTATENLILCLFTARRPKTWLIHSPFVQQTLGSVGGCGAEGVGVAGGLTVGGLESEEDYCWRICDSLAPARRGSASSSQLSLSVCLSLLFVCLMSVCPCSFSVCPCSHFVGLFSDLFYQ